MKLTATEFRKNLFSSLERTLQGEPVEVIYKGSTVRLVPEQAGSKLARLKPHDIVLCHPDSLSNSDPELLAEFEAEWQKDWKGL
jgi:hypothetical protein